MGIELLGTQKILHKGLNQIKPSRGGKKREGGGKKKGGRGEVGKKKKRQSALTQFHDK